MASLETPSSFCRNARGEVSSQEKDGCRAPKFGNRTRTGHKNNRAGQ